MWRLHEGFLLYEGVLVARELAVQEAVVARGEVKARAGGGSLQGGGGSLQGGGGST